MKKSKFFRVAVAGSTTDGRVIEATWIQQMADSYDPNTYTALGNLEHYRGFSPSSEFGTYAKVTALKAEEVEINGTKKLALFAQVDAFDQLIALHNAGQKLFTSIEVNPNFADTGKAYLVGLAFTDTPASLGTQIMEFAAKQPEANPFAGRKQDAANLFTAAEEASIEFEESESPGIFKKFMDLLKPKLEEKDNKDNGKFTEITQCLDEVAKTFNDTQTKLQKVETEFSELKTKHSKLEQDFTDLKAKLEGEENPGTPPAPENTGNFSEQIEC
ncbi:capsid protein [Acinetobacter baumannii]|nr:GPO family capsid scaffolding protein [Acinetobacter baumannii]MBC6785670.1 capsid protein [Acinetobacter baumannii]MBC6825097.1 capsid protein [Acinetobacter baumannii]PHP83934.1 capsid protein [Acinetobacter baumannii]RLS20278.1 capsid protein [Acinetobacter baumannii]CAI6141073.1 Capsid protein [Acinetobacter baumannii]